MVLNKERLNLVAASHRSKRMMRKRLQPRSDCEHVVLIVEEEHSSPELFYLKRAPPPRQPLFLPDKNYQDFMAGRPRRQKVSWLDGPKFAKGCTGFSLIAILFLVRRMNECSNVRLVLSMKCSQCLTVFAPCSCLLECW